MRTYQKLLALLSMLISITFAHDMSSSQDEFKYPCPVKWKRYRLNNDPAQYGIKSGLYSPDDRAFIGRGYINSVLTFGRIKIDGNAGFYTQMGSENFFNNKKDEIWYLLRNSDCKYSWADPDDESESEFVVDLGGAEYGMKFVIPRYSHTPPMKNGIFYGDDADASLKIRNITYELLTCRSKNPLTPPAPKLSTLTLPPIIKRHDASGCIHTWKFFKNNQDPLKDGISAGLYSTSNPAFVGMTRIGHVWRPSRIQVNSGAFALDYSVEEFYTNFSYYLVDNPQYNYYWVDLRGDEFIGNSVSARQDKGPFSFPIGRAEINGKTVIGLTDGVGGLIHPDENGEEHIVGQYQVLACDVVPKYKCVQKWKRYKFDTAPLDDGFLVGNYRDNIQSFIGRTFDPQALKHSIGRLQIAPKSDAGLYYFNSQLGRETLDISTSVEYLVKNPKDSYKWISSSAGKFVKNSMKINENGKFLIGRIHFDDKIYIGAVIGREGLTFTDYRGIKQTSKNYEVLTCFSAEYNENSDENFDENA